MQNSQSTLNQLLQKISSGRKFLRPSEDPFASARSLELEQNVARTSQFQDNISMGRGSIALQDTVLSGVMNVLQRTRELSLQGNNDTMGLSDRESIATELRERLGELMALGNTIGQDGDHLYAGHQGKTKPFQTVSIGQFEFVDYQGDQGRRFIQISDSRQIQEKESGENAFFRVPSSSAINTSTPVTNVGTGQAGTAYVFDPAAATGNTYRIQFNAGGATYDIIDETLAVTIVAAAAYTPGQEIEFDGIRTAINGAPALNDVFRFSAGTHQDIFTTMNKLVASLERSNSNAERQASMVQTLNDLDAASNHFSGLQAQVGGRLNALDSQEDENNALKLHTEEALSDLRDLDFTEAISQLQHNQFTLQAAQASFARIEGLSLFNYIS